MNRYIPTVKILAIILLAFLVVVSAVMACNVPVFRYALERWPSDLFEVVVFHRGPLSTEDETVAALLESHSSESGGDANFLFRTVDISLDENKPAEKYLETLGSPDMPCIAISFPRSSGIGKTIWSGRLTSEVARTLIDSPARREIVERILYGESAVWILLESGDSERDDNAAEILESQLSKMPGRLTLPSLDPLVLDSGNYSDIETADVRIDFSLLRLSRDNPEEKMLVDMLLNSEPDLAEYTTDPIAFPVYGRGRALYALVGNGIGEQNILEACAFVTGACSCEIKAQNPGVDLLIEADWDAGITNSVIVKMALPTLTSLSELARSAAALEKTIEDDVITADADYSHDIPDTLESVVTVSGGGNEIQNSAKPVNVYATAPQNMLTDSDISGSSSTILRNLLFMFIAIVVVITTLSLKVGARKTENTR